MLRVSWVQTDGSTGTGMLLKILPGSGTMSATAVVMIDKTKRLQDFWVTQLTVIGQRRKIVIAEEK
jgi:hypothetical protein